MKDRLRLALLAAPLVLAPAVHGQAAAARVSQTPSRGVAELPRTLPPLPRELVARRCTRSVRDGGDLQGALDKAHGGDVICLARGGRYVGNFTLRGRADTGWVVVRTELAAGEGPSAGERARPSTSGAFAKVVARPTDLAGSTLRTLPGARRWYLALLEITTDSTVRQGPTALITFGGGESRAAGRVPTDLVLDRVYAHGWPAQTLRRCVALNSDATAIVDSWLDECHEKGADSQAIVSWDGAGPYLIENNTLAGAGENLMFGGADPRTPGLNPADIVVRRNHIVTPPEWKGRWTKKNLVETKNVRRLLLEENVLDGSWADGQDGWAIILKSANQSGNCTWCVTADVVVRRNLIRNVGAGINVNGRGGDRRNIDSLSRRIEVTENYVERVGVAPYRGVGRLLMLLTGADEVLIAQNTLLSPPEGDLAAAIVLDARNSPSARRLVMERNVLSRGRYALAGCGTPDVMMECLPSGRVSGNILVGPFRPGDRLMPGFASVTSEAGALARAGVPRATVERATAGVVVAR